MYGMATLTNTNVYSNQANYVCSPFQLSLHFHPSPHWNKRVLAFPGRVEDLLCMAWRR